MGSAPPLLQVSGLRKAYAVPVLTDFTFELRSGEVHALVGANGAGKSTFARILCGLSAPDAGTIQLDGRPYAPASKRDADRAGVVLVLQELNVIGTLSIAENIFLTRLPCRRGLIDYTGLNSAARAALERVGLGHIDPSTPAARLGIGHQQLVGIAAALSRNCRVLILDEPTAALTDPEITQLFENIRRLQRDGVGVVYISHRMDELRRVAGRITVIRDGRPVATHDAGEVTPAELIREMVGHDLPERIEAAGLQAGPVAMRVDGLCAGKLVRDVSFDVRHGEILGIAGLVGAGRTEMLRALFGADPMNAGGIVVDGRPVVVRSPVDAVRAGIALVPEDRQRDGLLLPQSVIVNTTLSTVPRHAGRAGWLHPASEAATTEGFCRLLQVRCASPGQAVAELSGGNQQKVVIARWLARDCSILLFDEPTRGIDAAAKDAVYDLLRGLAAKGRAIVVVSSELVELMALCSRMLVMSQGRITAEFMPEEWSQEKIARAAFSGYLSSKEAMGNR
jgi:ribose transport system ATP-binding protein